jgi:DNA repair protein SbcC/Rad50
MQALGPFAKTEKIDFTLLGNNPLFLINGPTGSGKSTILDAICFALYGESTGKERNIEEMISDHAENNLHTEVTFTFSIGNKKYKIKRIPKQEKIKVKGTGTTEKNSEAILYAFNENNSETLLSNKIKDVNTKIIEIIGLGVEQFRQVIVLPQGKFRELLTVESTKREEIFSQLFQTHIYKEIQEKLKSKTSEIKVKVNEYLGKKSIVLESMSHSSIEILEEELDSITTTFEEVSSRKNSLFKLSEEANDKYKEGIRLQDRFSLLSSKQNEFSNLKSQETEISNAKIEIQNHERAMKIKNDFDKLNDLNLELNNVEGKYLTTLKDFEKFSLLRNESEITFNKAKENSDIIQKSKIERLKLQEMKITLDSILNLEINYKHENKKLDEITNTKNIIQNEIHNINLKIEDNEQVFLKNQNEILQIEALIYNSKNLKQAIESKNKSLNIQKEIKNLQDKINESSKNIELIKKEEADSKNNLNKIEYQWYLDQASFLAIKLEKDLPCPVCGSKSHPSPNVKSNNEKPISDDDLKFAREKYNQTVGILHKLESELDSYKIFKTQKENDISNIQENNQDFILESIESLMEKSSLLISKIDYLNKLSANQPNLAKQISGFKNDLLTSKQKQEKIELDERNIQNNLLKIKTELEIKNNELIDKNIELTNIEERINNLEIKIEKLNLELINSEKYYKQAQDNYIRIESILKSYSEQKNEIIEKLKLANLKWNNSLKEENFNDKQEYEKSLQSEEKINSNKTKIINFQTSLDTINGSILDLTKELSNIEIPDINILENNKNIYQLNFEKTNTEWISISERKNSLNNAKNQYKTIEEKSKDSEREFAIYGKLSNITSGTNEDSLNLQRFVLSVLLEDVLSQGSLRLQIMSKGRYRLHRKEDKMGRNKASGLDLEVYDEYTGYKRAVSTLSGGESFIAALSLALGLSDVVQSYAGGIKIDTLFIDEGFGSLDQESLELAIRALIDLQSTGRSIGIISHVTELKEQIKLQIDVQSTKVGSTIKMKNSLN